ISSPACGTTYATPQTVTVIASASDNVGVAKVEFYDGTTLKGTSTTSPYSYGWSITSANDGTHAWTAKAYDAAGNSTVSAICSLTINVPSPSSNVFGVNHLGMFNSTEIARAASDHVQADRVCINPITDQTEAGNTTSVYLTALAAS